MDRHPTRTKGRRMNTITELQDRAYQQSTDKGFHDDEPTEGRALLSLNAERIALMHSELSEALEELRGGWAANETYYKLPGVSGTYPSIHAAKSTIHGHGVTPKPEGVPSEMADVVIRILDFCGANDINLEAIILEKLDYNASRGRMHGGKKF